MGVGCAAVPRWAARRAASSQTAEHYGSNWSTDTHTAVTKGTFIVCRLQQGPSRIIHRLMLNQPWPYSELLQHQFNVFLIG